MPQRSSFPPFLVLPSGGRNSSRPPPGFRACLVLSGNDANALLSIIWRAGWGLGGVPALRTAALPSAATITHLELDTWRDGVLLALSRLWADYFFKLFVSVSVSMRERTFVFPPSPFTYISPGPITPPPPRVPFLIIVYSSRVFS